MRAADSDDISGLEFTDCGVVLWEQEAAGSNPAIPTKHAGRRVCRRLSVGPSRSFDRHLTVRLNANRRQRLSRTGLKGHGKRLRARCVLNRFLALPQSAWSSQGVPLELRHAGQNLTCLVFKRKGQGDYLAAERGSIRR